MSGVERPAPVHGSSPEYTSEPESTDRAQQDAADLEIVDRCRAGDTPAFEILVFRYQTVLFNVALRMLGERADAADATQTTFVKMFERLDSFDRRYRFFSWMYRILRNECLNVLRARRRRESAAAVPAPVDAVDPLQAMEAAERQFRIRAGLLRLSDEDREIVVLRYIAGLSHADMSAALEIPEKTVKSRLHTARHRLARILLGPP